MSENGSKNDFPKKYCEKLVKKNMEFTILLYLHIFFNVKGERICICIIGILYFV